MRFEGDTEECNDCGEIISSLNDFGFEDVNMCGACAVKHIVERKRSPCKLCKKPIGEAEFMWDDDATNFAHKDCVEKLPEEQQEDDWSDDF